MSPEDPDALRSIAAEMQHSVSHLRWMRDCITQLYQEQNPRLGPVALEVSTVLALTPVLAKALIRVSKALANEPPPESPTRTRRTRR